MLDVWLELLERGASVDLGWLAPVGGVVVGVLLALVLAVPLLVIGAVVERWARRRRDRAVPRPKPMVVRFIVPPDDWSPDLDQFTEAERARLWQLRSVYRQRAPRPQEIRPKQQ